MAPSLRVARMGFMTNSSCRTQVLDQTGVLTGAAPDCAAGGDGRKPYCAHCHTRATRLGRTVTAVLSVEWLLLVVLVRIWSTARTTAYAGCVRGCAIPFAFLTFDFFEYSGHFVAWWIALLLGGARSVAWKPRAAVAPQLNSRLD